MQPRQSVAIPSSRHINCLASQENLRKLLKKKIKENKPLTPTEKQEFYRLLPLALLSQGTLNPVHNASENGWFIWESFQSLCHRMGDLTTKYVSLKTDKPETVEVIGEIKELWTFIHDKCNYLFPLAVEQI